MKAIIITPCLSGKIQDSVKAEPGDFIICADNSFTMAMSEGFRPSLIIGDFDTGFPADFPENTEVMRFPVEKDDTDTMLCIKEAEKRGFSEITVVGGLSGRLDHTFANIQSMVYGKTRGIDIVFSDSVNSAFIMSPGETEIAKKSGFSLSIFSYGEKAENITLSGVKYPLSGGTLENSFPLGVSNEITAEKAKLSFSSGMLLVIISKL